MYTISELKQILTVIKLEISFTDQHIQNQKQMLTGFDIMIDPVIYVDANLLISNMKRRRKRLLKRKVSIIRKIKQLEDKEYGY